MVYLHVKFLRDESILVLVLFLLFVALYSFVVPALLSIAFFLLF